MKILRISFRTALGVLLLACTVFTFFIGRNKISEGHSVGEAESYKGVITLWHIDSFEGGVGSRKQFLLKVARSFEKKYNGVLVMVIEHTEQSVLEEIKNDKLPDILSFGAGVEISGFTELSINIEKNNNGGLIGERTYALPWCRGGYVLIANPKLKSEISDNLESLLVSQGEYTQPLTALYLEGITANNISVKKPMDAYVEFVSGKIPYFLGTQRDINRLERRQFEVITRPLKQYNDILQYVALTAKSQQKAFYAQSFIEHLMSEEAQKSLNEIGMFSSITQVEYSNPHLNEMQEFSSFLTVSAFSNAKSLKEMQENSLLLIKGRKELETKIKNMLV